MYRKGFERKSDTLSLTGKERENNERRNLDGTQSRSPKRTQLLGAGTQVQCRP
jgi:hypothetical protein